MGNRSAIGSTKKESIGEWTGRTTLKVFSGLLIGAVYIAALHTMGH
ncbi:hypothetical protein [Sphingobacterium sp. xlx-130]|nr:hypothetical protein [Sphingobacterium sp. xlx-130]